VLQSEVENEQCLRRLVGRAHSDNSEPCHEGPWKLEDRPCSLRVAQGEFSLSNKEYLSLAQSFSVTSENIAVNRVLQKRDSLAHTFISDRMGLYFNDDDVICPNSKAAEFGEITQNIGHYTTFTTIQGLQFRHQWKAGMRLSMCK